MTRYPLEALSLGSVFGFGLGFVVATTLMEYDLNQQLRRIGRARAEMVIAERKQAGQARVPPQPATAHTPHAIIDSSVPVALGECISELNEVRLRLSELQERSDSQVNEARNQAREAEADTRAVLDINAGLANDNHFLREKCK